MKDENLLRKIRIKLEKAIPLLTPLSIRDKEVKEAQDIMLEVCTKIDEVYPRL